MSLLHWGCPLCVANQDAASDESAAHIRQRHLFLNSALAFSSEGLGNKCCSWPSPRLLIVWPEPGKFTCIDNFCIATLPSQLSHFSCLFTQEDSFAQLWFGELVISYQAHGFSLHLCFWEVPKDSCVESCMPISNSFCGCEGTAALRSVWFTKHDYTICAGWQF